MPFLRRLFGVPGAVGLVLMIGVLAAVPTLMLIGSRRPVAAAPVIRRAAYDEPKDTLVPPRLRATPTPTPLASPTPAPTPTPILPTQPVSTPHPTARPAPPPPPPPPPPPTPPAAGLPSFSHVFTIVLENHEYEGLIGNPQAPYLNSLAQSYGLATAYYAVSHPSLPNYLALTAGSTFGITNDCTTCFVSAPNIADQVEASGRSWKAYMEDMPSPCYLGAGSGGYALKHDPFLYFTDIRNNPTRCARVVPFTQFGSDLQSGAVPNYAWITPNLCNDMHDCAPSVGDTWLRTVVPSILASSAWRSGGVLFITVDEGVSNAGCCGNSYGGHVMTLVISPMGRHGFQSGLAETHYSLLRAVEDAWHLGELGAASCGCTGRMAEYF